jgi:hypothetical protein
MIIFLPLILLLLVFGLLSGETNIVFVLPTLLMLGAGVGFVAIALRDGGQRRDPSVPTLPADHLRRHMYRTVRPHRLTQRGNRDAKAE